LTTRELRKEALLDVHLLGRARPILVPAAGADS